MAHLTRDCRISSEWGSSSCELDLNYCHIALQIFIMIDGWQIVLEQMEENIVIPVVIPNI